MKNLILRWGRAALAGIVFGASLPATAGPIQLISAAVPSLNSPAGGGGDSWAPMLSPDGRYVLFTSTANNLVLTTNNPPIPLPPPVKLNVFLRDRITGTTTLVSANLTGQGGGNGGSLPSDISTDGRYAVFESNASDLVLGDTNNATDVFMRDPAAGLTLLVSANSAGNAGNGASRSAAMTSDGRYVAFVSAASDLVPDDTNGIPDVFVRDMQGGSSILVSIGATSAGTFLGYATSSSESPDITPDGRRVAFFSTATNLVPGVQTIGDVYVRDLTNGTTYWASVNARAVLFSTQGATNGVCYNHIISADGQFVAFEVSGIAGSNALTPGIVLRHNLANGQTDVVNTNACVPRMPFEDIHNLEMTPDGRFIAFVANTNGATGATTCICVWDGNTGTTTLGSGNLSNAVPPKTLCDKPALSTNGQYVAFLSGSTNMVTNALTGDFHVYLRDVNVGLTVLLDADTNGAGCPINPETSLCLSADGRFAAFESVQGGLDPGSHNRASDVIVRDILAGTSEVVSSGAAALPSFSSDGVTMFWPGSLSADGRYIILASEADNLVPNDTNLCRDVFLRDLAAGTNLLVSVDTNGFSGDGLSTEAVLSGNGRYVAFTSDADNLVAGDTNKAADVFVRDLVAGATTLVSVKVGGTGPGNKHSYSPAISTDGRYVMFLSKATDLAAGSFSGTENLFVRDLQLGTNYALTTGGMLSAAMTPDGRYVCLVPANNTLCLWDSSTRTAALIPSTGGPVIAAISTNGNRIAYSSSSGLYLRDRSAGTTSTLGTAVSGSHPGLRFSADSRFLVYARPLNSTNQVYLYDCQNGTSLLVSHRSGSSAEATGASDWPDVSPDARFVAYRSMAVDIVPGVTNGVPAIYLYDRQSGVTTLFGGSQFGNYPATGRALSPLFGSDSRTLFFASWSPDLLAQDVNQTADVFSYDLYGFLSWLMPGAIPAQPPLLTWPVVPGKTYRVQYKNKLSDSSWQTVGGVTIVGNQGWFTDSTAPVSQRFYRILAY
jgi:Tol biopolymer transport system component